MTRENLIDGIEILQTNVDTYHKAAFFNAGPLLEALSFFSGGSPDEEAWMPVENILCKNLFFNISF